MAGKMVHFELPAADAQRAKQFWSGVFGWDFGDSAMEGMEYYMVRTGEDQGGAVYPMPDHAGTGWLLIHASSGSSKPGPGRIASSSRSSPPGRLRLRLLPSLMR